MAGVRGLKAIVVAILATAALAAADCGKPGQDTDSIPITPRRILLQTVAYSSASTVVTGTGTATASAGSSASNGGVSVSEAISTSNGGDSMADAQADAGPGETSIATAIADSEEGRTAQAIARAPGGVEGVTTVATAIAEAVGTGDGPAVAVAVADAVRQGYKFEAVNALVESFALASTEGNGPAIAEAIATGLLEGGETSETYAAAVAKLLENQGCENTRPTLAEARATAVSGGYERAFVDALDFDVRIAECIIEECSDERLGCCNSEGTSCLCADGSCQFSLYKTTPRPTWYCDSCEQDICLCPFVEEELVNALA